MTLRQHVPLFLRLEIFFPTSLFLFVSIWCVSHDIAPSFSQFNILGILPQIVLSLLHFLLPVEPSESRCSLPHSNQFCSTSHRRTTCHVLTVAWTVCQFCQLLLIGCVMLWPRPTLATLTTRLGLADFGQRTPRAPDTPCSGPPSAGPRFFSLSRPPLSFLFSSLGGLLVFKHCVNSFVARRHCGSAVMSTKNFWVQNLC